MNPKDPFGPPPGPPPQPGQHPQQPYGTQPQQPNPYAPPGAYPQQPNPYAPPGAPPNPYGANPQQPYPPQPNPYAPQPPYPQQPNPYAQQAPYGQAPNPYAQPNPYGPPPQGLAPVSAPLAANKTDGIILLVCCGLILLGLGSYSWFTMRGEGGIGILGVQECRGAICKSMTWFDIKRAPSEIVMFATVGLLGAATAIGFLIHAAVVLLKQRPSSMKKLGVRLSLGAAAFGCTGFFFTLMFGELSKRLSIGWSGFPAIAAIITAGVITQRVAKRTAAPPPPAPLPHAQVR